MVEESLLCGSWYAERIAPDYAHVFVVKEHIYTGRTSLQRVDVIRHEIFGKILLLDGKPQLSTFDEWIYHELLVHPPMLAHPSPRKVAILGGGDGGALREVLKHPTVEEVFLIDIDREVIEICKKYLPEVNAGAFDDRRVRIVVKDARKFIQETSEKFDVIIADLTDPISGISESLYTKDFYLQLQRNLEDNGIFCTQAESIYFSHLYFRVSFPTIVKTIRSVFERSSPYKAWIPSFGCEWAYCIASNSIEVDTSWKFAKKKLEEIKLDTRYYDADVQKSAFCLPKNIRKLIESVGRVIEDRDLRNV